MGREFPGPPPPTLSAPRVRRARNVALRAGTSQGKRILVTGVLTDDSLAYGVAEMAQREGAEVVLTSFGRALSLTRRVAKHLPAPPDVLELDVTVPEHIETVAAELQRRWGALDGLAPLDRVRAPVLPGRRLPRAPWEDVRSGAGGLGLLAQVADRGPVAPFQGGRRRGGGRLSTSTPPWRGPATTGWGWPSRPSSQRPATWPGTSASTRCGSTWWQPARSDGRRPAIPGISRFEEVWGERAPLGWDIKDSSAVAKACVALISDLFPATTGEMVHVDGGFHAMGVLRMGWRCEPGRVVLVTGGNRGIGRAVAAAFADCGDRVAITTRAGPGRRASSA